MASSGRPLDLDPRGVTTPDVTRGPRLHRRAIGSLGGWRSDGAARWVFIWPTVVVILFLSIFPLVASLTLAFSELVFARGRIQVDFVGLQNFQILFFGTERSHLLGVLKTPTPLGWVVFGLGAALIVRALVDSLTRGRGPADRGDPADRRRAPRGRPPVARRADVVQRGRPARLTGRHDDLRLRRHRGAVPAGPRPGAPGRPAAARTAVLPGRLHAAADDHADRRRLHVPDDDRHREGPAGTRLRRSSAWASTPG